MGWFNRKQKDVVKKDVAKIEKEQYNKELEEFERRQDRLNKLMDIAEQAIKAYEMSIIILKQEYRHAISLKSSYMRSKAYKELQDKLIFAEASFEAVQIAFKEAKEELLFFKEFFKDKGNAYFYNLVEENIAHADKVLSLRLEDEEDYMDIKYFCKEKLEETIL